MARALLNKAAALQCRWARHCNHAGLPPTHPSCPARHLPNRPHCAALPADADEATALQNFMLAALKSFVRRYNVQCAQLAERIGAEVLGGEGVPQELREAVETQLNL